jgi:peptide/nickel transport system substrate-binding protein
MLRKGISGGILRKLILAAAALSAFVCHGAHADGTLRFGLEFDPDVMDPARNGSYTDRVVFTTMCDQLLDVDDKLALTLKLRDGVTFQDGTPLDADAVRLNLERYRSAPESIRKTELKPVVGVDVIDKLTLRIRLSQPYAPLLSLLANRPGTPLSPKVIGKTTEEIVAGPTCTGPFRFTSRVAQDRITLDRYPGYWNAANIHFDRVVFHTLVDPTVRLVNLQSGQIDIANRLAATDAAAVEADRRLRLVTSPSLGFQLLSFNIASTSAADTPLGRDPRVRAAFEKSIDREALNQVVFEGRFVPSNQTEPPGSRYWNPAYPVPKRDVEGARALLKAAGVDRVAFTLYVGNDAVNGQIAQVMQSMAAEAGFDIKIEQRESAALVAGNRAGAYQAAMVIWSGRPDPDGNATIWASCGGFVNWGRYCNPKLDTLFAQGAAVTDPAERVPLYRKAVEIMQEDRSHMVLFHFTWLWGMSAKVGGFVPMADGLMRPAGVRFTQ